MNNKKLLVISGYIDNASHIGGVTMHVHRLLKRLIEQNVTVFDICDYKKEGLREQLQKIKTADVMHIHASNPILKLFYVLVGKIYNTESLITVHGKYRVYSIIKNLIHFLALKWCDIPILINKESYDAVKKFNPRAVFIPAFIPPIEEEEYLPQEIMHNIIDIKKDGKPLFVTNASSRAFTDDGREIYGIDFLINYFKCHPAYNLIILDPSDSYTPIYEKRLPKNVFLFNGNYSFCGFVKMSDVVIRNTPTDGDSLSVKETLYLHKPIIASDSVSRPDGVILFKYNEETSFSNAIRKALSKEVSIDTNVGDGAIEEYYRLYCSLGIISNKSMFNNNN